MSDEYGCALPGERFPDWRGDFGRLVLEEGANLQDNCVMHGFPGKDTVVGVDGHIGHGAVLHGCTIGPGALVGMNCVVNDNAEVGEDCVVAAMAFVKAEAKIPAAMPTPWAPPRRSRSPARTRGGATRTSACPARPNARWRGRRTRRSRSRPRP